MIDQTNIITGASKIIIDGMYELYNAFNGFVINLIESASESDLMSLI